MNKENTEKLFHDFPNLYSGRTKSVSENLMPYGFECGDGWFNLIYDLSEKISKLDPNCVAVQVKEKFGGLRFYTEPTTKEVFHLTLKYGDMSFFICELCGETKGVKLRGGNWIKNLCDKCNYEWTNNRDEVVNRIYKKKKEEIQERTSEVKEND